MKLTDRRTKTIFQTCILIAALSLQACATGIREESSGKAENDKVSTTPLSKMQVRRLKDLGCGPGQGHIETESNISITEDANGKISEIKFHKLGSEDYIFKGVKETSRDAWGDITVIRVTALQVPIDKHEHKFEADLVKLKNQYVYINFDYWDESPASSAHKCCAKGHGRGGGGGWN